MLKLLGVLGIGVIISALFLVSSIITIWAVNVLFHAGWPQDWSHRLAVLWCLTTIGGWATFGKKAAK